MWPHLKVYLRNLLLTQKIKEEIKAPKVEAAPTTERRTYIVLMGGSPQGSGSHRTSSHHYASSSSWQELRTRSFGLQLHKEFQWICGEAHKGGSRRTARYTLNIPFSFALSVYI